MPDWISNNFYGPAIVIFVGILIAAFGGVWASMEQNTFDRTLKKKNEEIVELNRKIINSVTGGESYCYFQVMKIGNSKVVDLFLVNTSEYPVYDVSVTITDAEKRWALVKKNIPYGSVSELYVITSKASESFNIGNMVPNQGKLVYSLELKDKEKYSFNITISARNGIIYQSILFLKVNDEWKTATRAIREGEVLYENIYHDFPRNESGEVEW